ncbi:MAG: acetyl-CoA carboxylase biotin carboxylase subunit [Deltaproteobacteria bacterium]|nr:acetyl-CoA carboxylase biotin carboxylase subunit [Deltaproteobacteria bacterium]
MFRKVLIANRGEIAVRVIRACRELGVATVAAYSTADRDALHVRLADEQICIGPPPPEQSYLNMPALISAAQARSCDAIHPGYGFLSENGDFAEACQRSGLVFIGPRVRNVKLMGDKARARRFMRRAGVPVLPGSSSSVRTLDEGRQIAREIGYPVLVKATGGGGGRGLRVVHEPAELEAAIEASRGEGQAAFGQARIYIEKYVERARHIEIQIIADQSRNAVQLGERECSLQRRYQKVLEESPSVALDRRLRARMGRSALRVAAAIGYTNVGTVEFLLDPQGGYYFIEMNTRVQVEHGVTEMLTGVDVVKEGIRAAAGLALSVRQRDVVPVGHAIECRINAEDPFTMRPSPGTVRALRLPGGPGIRVDSALQAGGVVPPYYDSLVAKLLAHGRDRTEAIARMRRALAELQIEGIVTNVALHQAILEDDDFLAGRIHTRYLEGWNARRALEPARAS